MSLKGVENLVYMANQIARFFVAQPGDQAALATRDHLVSFWTPAMRRAVVAHRAAGGAGLSPAAAEAVSLLDQTASAERTG